MQDSVAVVTGASSGIGRATAIALADRGVRVVLAARRSGLLSDLEAEIRRRGGEACSRTTDVSSRDQVEALVAETLERFGKIDLAVAGAGLYVRGPAPKVRTEDFENAMAVNFYGVIHLMYAVLPHMLARRSGHLVAISSVDGKKGLPLDAPYVSSKFAVTGFMDVLRQELRGTGVHATTILPGRVDTPMIDDLAVPWISAKISSERVARTVVRSVRRGRAEVIVPWLGPKTLVVMNAFAPAAADWLVRFFRLEGRAKPSSDQR